MSTISVARLADVTPAKMLERLRLSAWQESHNPSVWTAIRPFRSATKQRHKLCCRRAIAGWSRPALDWPRTGSYHVEGNCNARCRLAFMATVGSGHNGKIVSTIAVARLSDGTLQLWVVGKTALLSAWQEPNNPSVWTAIRPFTPQPTPPPPNSDAGPYASIAAGRSPAGRVQLWIGPAPVVTTWKETATPGAGWFSWQPFLFVPADEYEGDNEYPADLTVGQLPDGRVQLFADNALTIWTTWKETTKVNESWNGWRKFDPQPPANVFYTNPAAGILSDDRLHLWAQEYTDTPVRGPGTYLTTWQTSAVPYPDGGFPWNNWQIPTVPAIPKSIYDPGVLVVAPLPNGGNQMWVALENKLSTSYISGSSGAWTPWQSFLSGAGQVGDIAVVTHADGSVQVFIVSLQTGNSSWEILTTSKATANDAGWTSWESLGTFDWRWA